MSTTPLLRLRSKPARRISVSTIWQISSARAWITSPSTWRAMIRGLRPPTLGTSIESSSGTIEVSAQPCFFLIFSASFTGRAQRHRHVVREVLAADLQHRGVPERALLEDGEVGGAAADVHQRHAQLLLVRGQAGLGRARAG